MPYIGKHSRNILRIDQQKNTPNIGNFKINFTVPRKILEQFINCKSLKRPNIKIFKILNANNIQLLGI